MKIEKTPLEEEHQVRLTVELEQERMDRAKKRAARQLSKQHKIAGFRPGKAPYPIVVQHFGEGAIIQDALDTLIEDIYPKALEAEEIEPGAQGILEDVESTDPPIFKFLIPLRSEVKLGDYRSLRVPYQWMQPSDAEVDEKLEELRGMYATLASVERPAETGDFLLVNVVGKTEDDEVVFEKEKHAVHLLEKEREKEEPFMGFGDALIGKNVDDELTVEHTFADDYEDETLQGKTVTYAVRVDSVQSTEYPKLDDDFAKTLGAGETMEELRDILQKDLEMQSRNEYDDEYFTEVMDAIKDISTIKYPPQVLERETEAVIEDIKSRLAQQGMEFEAYLKMQDTTLEKFTDEEARPIAEKRLERGLLFDELVREEEIEVNETDLQQEFVSTMQDLAQQGYDLNNVKGGERAQREIANNIATQSATQVITRKTLERIKLIVTGEQEKLEAEAAVKAAEEEKEAEAAKEQAEAAEEAPAEEVEVKKEEAETKEEDTEEEA